MSKDDIDPKDVTPIKPAADSVRLEFSEDSQSEKRLGLTGSAYRKNEKD